MHSNKKDKNYNFLLRLLTILLYKTWYFFIFINIFIMKTKTLWLVAILAIAPLALAGCNKNNTPVENPNVEIANPASVYCEENGGTLVLEEWAWLCMFEDWSYCEEWSYYRNECQQWEIMYNTIEETQIWMANPASVYCTEQGWESIIKEDEEWNQYWICKFADWSEIDEWEYFRANNSTDLWTSELFSEEDLAAAEATIMNAVNNEWNVKVESFTTNYAGDEMSTSQLNYCQSLNAEVAECAVFTSSFHIPEQDTQMAWAFEPNTDINWYSWYLGRATAGEWEILTNGFG